MIDEKRLENDVISLQQCINSLVKDSDMKKELVQLLHNDFYNDNELSLYKQVINRSIGWFYLITSMKNYKISDLNWQLLCELHDKNINNKLNENKCYYEEKDICTFINKLFKCYKKTNIVQVRTSFKEILNKLYIEIYNSGEYLYLENIRKIYKYKVLLRNNSMFGHREYKEDQDILDLISNTSKSFVVNSNCKEIIQIEYNTPKDDIIQVNLNIRTQCKFIRDILTQFLYTYNNPRYISSKDMRIFLYYFTETLGVKYLRGYEDINEKAFKHQYDFYKRLGSVLKDKQLLERPRNLKEILVSFYRYFINIMEKLNINYGFSSSFKQALYLKNFYKFYEEGFYFVYHNTIELPPDSYKYCILPSVQTLLSTDCNNIKLIAINLEDVPEKYKSDVKDFIWKADGNIKNRANYLYKLIEFLNIKTSYDKLYIDFELDLPKEHKEFSENFLWDYRITMDNEVKGSDHLKNILKIVRKYMKYFKKKYNVTNNDLNILNLKGLGKFDGGKPISEKDSKLIYKQFEMLETIIFNGRLYTILYEIFMLTNLRFGEILNLRRDCLNKENDPVKLIYLSKTSSKQFVKQDISQAVAALIDEAIALTEPYIAENDIMAQYIFIEPYEAKHVPKVKRINFYTYFKNVLQAIEETLEIKDYSPYNIRHTFINTVYKKGIENNLSIQEISCMTGNSYKTANMHYRKYSEIELYVEAMAKVTISDVDIHGNILETEENNKYKVVKKNLGKCRNEHCTFDIAECLICRFFVTFINRIPYFEQQIMDYNKIIENSLNPIEIKELNIQKKMLAKFLAEMYRMQKLKG